MSVQISWQDPLFGEKHDGVPPQLADRLEQMYRDADGMGRHTYYEQMNALLALNAVARGDNPRLRDTAAEQARSEGCSQRDIALALDVDHEPPRGTRPS